MRPFLLPLLCLCAAGQNYEKAFAELSETRLRADLTFLTSEPLQGRLSLERGSEVSIQWLVSEFTKAGLKPAANGSFLQSVPLTDFRVDREKSGLTITRNGVAKSYRSPEAGVSFPKPGRIKGPIVFAGFGITAPELNYDDYAGLDVKGKVVLIFDHEPQESDPNSIFSGKGNTRYAGTYVKVLTAQQHGAVAVLLMPEPNRNHPSNEERRARIPGSAQRNARLPQQTLENSSLQIPLITIAEALGKDLVAATGQTANAIHTAIDRDLKPRSALLPGITADIDIVNTQTKLAETFNVVGLLEGSDLKDETIIISAHHDHDGPAFNLGAQFPGADDNGSGTVGVVALAHAFMKAGVKPRRSILFAIFGAEERGLLGSYHYADHPLRPLAGTKAVINFDMIGRDEKPSTQTDGLITIAPDTSNEMNLVGAYYSPDYAKAVEKANEFVGLRLNNKWDMEPALNVFFRSDQYPFVLKDIPALWWFTGFHPDYHQVTDSVELINFPKMGKILQLAYRTTWDFANTATPPRFVSVTKGAPDARVYFLGQPSQADLSNYAKLGVKTVINLRTAAEMEKVGFDEAAAAKAAGMNYVNVPFQTIPTDGELAKIYAELDKSGEGKILLHCGSSNRVGGVWAAYRATQKGVAPEEAMNEGKAAGLKNPALEKAIREKLGLKP